MLQITPRLQKSRPWMLFSLQLWHELPSPCCLSNLQFKSPVLLPSVSDGWESCCMAKPIHVALLVLSWALPAPMAALSQSLFALILPRFSSRLQPAGAACLHQAQISGNPLGIFPK